MCINHLYIFLHTHTCNSGHESDIWSFGGILDQILNNQLFDSILSHTDIRCPRKIKFLTGFNP